MEKLRIGLSGVNKNNIGMDLLTKQQSNLAKEILKLIDKDDYNYMDVNRVLYTLDRELQYRANNNKL